VSLLVDEYDDDWSQLWWVRVDGTGQVTDFEALPAGLLEALQVRYPWYVDNPPSGPVIDVVATQWTGWAFTEK
jgi:hypothetical protein